MSSRRDFLKGSLALGVVVAAGRAGQAQAGYLISDGTRLHEGQPRAVGGEGGGAPPQGHRRGGKGHDPDAAPDDPTAFHRQAHAPHPGRKDHRREDLHCRRPEGGIDLRPSCGLQGRALGHELLQPARSLADGIYCTGLDGEEGATRPAPFRLRHGRITETRGWDNFRADQLQGVSPSTPHPGNPSSHPENAGCLRGVCSPCGLCRNTLPV